MQDKLAELKEVARRRNPIALIDDKVGGVNEECSSDPTRSNATENGDAKSGGNKKPKHPDFMKEYFEKISILKTAVNEIGNNVDKIKHLKRSAMEATSPDREKEISHQLNKLVNGTNLMLTKTKRALEVIKQENVEFTAKHTDSAEAKIRANMHQALSRQFRTVFQEYQSAQTDYKHEVKQKVARQVKIVFPEASEEEVQDMMEAGNMTSAIAIRSRISGGHEMLRNAVADLEDKHRDIRRLEENVAELYQMFVEVATVVEHQGELLDQIEFSVTQAKEYTEKAEGELITARKYQATAKKRMCWIVICLLILLVIVLLPILITMLRP